MHDPKHTPAARAPLRLMHAAQARPVARVDLSRPGSAEALSEVTNDWLYRACGDDGKRKLLREHDLLAA